MKLLASFMERTLLGKEQFRVCFSLFQGLLGSFKRFFNLLFLATGRAEGFDGADLVLDVGHKDRFYDFGFLCFGRFFVLEAVPLGEGFKGKSRCP